jgi:hypothetical protein
MGKLVGPQFNGTADYDCIVTAVFRTIDDFVAMKKDPFYIEKVMPDHENFADTQRSKYIYQCQRHVEPLLTSAQDVRGVD